MASEREIFNKVMNANGAPSAVADPKSAPAPAPVTTRDTRVAPEVIWAEGAKIKEQKAAKAAAVKAEPAAPEEPERALDGKFTNEEKKQESFDDAKYELAREALASSGWKKKELDEWFEKNPDDFLKRGLKRATVVERDREAHRLAKEAREARTAPQASGKTEQVSKPAEFKLPDTTALLAPLTKALALDEDGAKALRQTFDEFASVLSKTTVAPLQEKLAQFETMQLQAGARSETELVNAAREEVGKRYPDLLDPETFETVAENVRVLGNLPKYQRIASLTGRVNACFEDACKLLGLQSAESDSQVRDDEKAQRRASGSTVGDRARPAALTSKEKDREWFDQVAAKNGLN